MEEIGRKFMIELIEKVKPFIGKTSADRNDAEKRLWNILTRTNNVNAILDSLDVVFKYLKVENRDEVLKIFEIDSSKNYFKYHMENYIIRITSLPDALAWLTNIVLNLGYTKNLYGTTIKNLATCPQSLKTKMDVLLTRIEEIRKSRHIKIHEGEVKLPYFSDIVFFGELSVEVSDLLRHFTEEGVEKQISSLTKELNEVRLLVGDYMDELTQFI